MTQTVTIHSYDRVARALHWSMAILIVALMAVGLSFDAFPDSLEKTVVGLHVTFGALTLALLIVRFAWRITHRPPPLAADTPRLMRLMAWFGHAALYAVLAATLLAGLATAFLRNIPIDFGLFSIPSPVAVNRALSRGTKEVHEIAAWTLMALAGGHVVAAVWHDRVLRDGTLRRMLPQTARLATDR